MKNIQLISGSGGVVVASCPQGKAIRILSVVMSLSSQAEADQIEIRYIRDATVIALTATNPITASVGNVAAAIGLGHTDARQAVVNIATGDVTYDQSLNTMNAPLPDADWPWDVQINCTGAVSTVVGQINVAYEILD